MRKCSRCGKKKRLAAFYKSRTRPGGLQGWCKVCSNSRGREYWATARQSLLPKRNKFRYDNPEHVIVLRLRARAKAKGLPFALTADDIHIPSHCPILGIPLQINKGRLGCTYNSPSVDRFVAAKGYVPGNIFVISQLANQIKNAGTPDQVMAVGEWMKKIEEEQR